MQALCSWENLCLAAYKAFRNKRQRPDVLEFLGSFDARIASLQSRISTLQVPLGPVREFWVHDPKRRKITAASLDDRVLHHAILNLTESVFEDKQLDASFACRPGKGVHAAVLLVQKNLRKYRYYLKLDIQSYFASIEHEVLHRQLARCFRGVEFLQLLRKILETHSLGIPIGNLTSQHFANLYLTPVDRLLKERLKVPAYIRYMDDLIWWRGTKLELQADLEVATFALSEQLGLQVKQSSVQLGASAQGVSYCGYRVLPQVILPSSRKKRAFRQVACRVAAAVEGESALPELHLQRAIQGAQSLVAHCQSREFSRTVWYRESLEQFSAWGAT